MVALYFSRSSRPTMVLIGSSGCGATFCAACCGAKNAAHTAATHTIARILPASCFLLPASCPLPPAPCLLPVERFPDTALQFRIDREPRLFGDAHVGLRFLRPA